MAFDLKGARRALLAGPLMLLSACGLFDDEEILEGERLAVRPQTDEAAEVARDVALALAPPTRRPDWTHKNGSAGHAVPHPALGGDLSRLWSTDVGRGSNRDSRLTAAPIIAEGRIYTLDAAAEVRGIGLDGDVLWRADLAPDDERGEEGFGGGLAFGGGRLIATTGFGEVLALDPATGEILWRRAVDAPFRSGPVISGNRIVAVSRDDIAYGVDLESGRVAWRRQGARGSAGLIGGADPAAAAGVAVVPFASGELSGFIARSGRPVWSIAVSGSRRGLTRATIPDITGDPVIIGERVFAANQSGALVALNSRSGARLWTRGDGSLGPVWPAGGSVFFVSDTAELVRADAATGATIWRQDLPEYRNERRRANVILYYGPIIAGGQLLVASSEGDLLRFDPATGEARGEIDIPGGAGAQMAVADGRLYILSRRAVLHAYQ